MLGRHLTAEERKTLRDMLDSCGPVEVLRVVAQCVAHDHPALDVGNRLRSEICAAASQVEFALKEFYLPDGTARRIK